MLKFKDYHDMRESFGDTWDNSRDVAQWAGGVLGNWLGQRRANRQQPQPVQQQQRNQPLSPETQQQLQQHSAFDFNDHKQLTIPQMDTHIDGLVNTFQHMGRQKVPQQAWQALSNLRSSWQTLKKFI